MGTLTVKPWRGYCVRWVYYPREHRKDQGAHSEPPEPDSGKEVEVAQCDSILPTAENKRTWPIVHVR